MAKTACFFIQGRVHVMPMNKPQTFLTFSNLTLAQYKRHQSRKVKELLKTLGKMRLKLVDQHYELLLPAFVQVESGKHEFSESFICLVTCRFASKLDI